MKRSHIDTTLENQEAEIKSNNTNITNKRHESKIILPAWSLNDLKKMELNELYQLQDTLQNEFQKNKTDLRWRDDNSLERFTFLKNRKNLDTLIIVNKLIDYKKKIQEWRFFANPLSQELYWIIKRKDTAALDKLIKREADTWERFWVKVNQDKYNPIRLLAYEEDNSSIKFLIEKVTEHSHAKSINYLIDNQSIPDQKRFYDIDLFNPLFDTSIVRHPHFGKFALSQILGDEHEMVHDKELQALANANLEDPVLGEILIGIAMTGNDEKVEKFIEKYGGLKSAALGYALNDNDLCINNLLEKHPELINYVLLGYAIAGNVNKVNYFIEKKGANINWAIQGYAMGDHEFQMEDLIHKGGCRSWAVRGFLLMGHYQKAEEQNSKGPNALHSLIIFYAMQGNTEKVNQLLDEAKKRSRDDYDAAVDAAINGYAYVGNQDEVNKFLKYEYDREIYLAMKSYATAGHNRLVYKVTPLTKLDDEINECEKKRTDSLLVLKDIKPKRKEFRKSINEIKKNSNYGKLKKEIKEMSPDGTLKKALKNNNNEPNNNQQYIELKKKYNEQKKELNNDEEYANLKDQLDKNEEYYKIKYKYRTSKGNIKELDSKINFLQKRKLLNKSLVLSESRNQAIRGYAAGGFGLQVLHLLKQGASLGAAIIGAIEGGQFELLKILSSEKINKIASTPIRNAEALHNVKVFYHALQGDNQEVTKLLLTSKDYKNAVYGYVLGDHFQYANEVLEKEYNKLINAMKKLMDEKNVQINELKSQITEMKDQIKIKLLSVDKYKLSEEMNKLIEKRTKLIGEKNKLLKMIENQPIDWETDDDQTHCYKKLCKKALIAYKKCGYLDQKNILYISTLTNDLGLRKLLVEKATVNLTDYDLTCISNEPLKKNTIEFKCEENGLRYRIKLELDNNEQEKIGIIPFNILKISPPYTDDNLRDNKKTILRVIFNEAVLEQANELNHIMKEYGLNIKQAEALTIPGVKEWLLYGYQRNINTFINPLMYYKITSYMIGSLDNDNIKIIATALFEHLYKNTIDQYKNKINTLTTEEKKEFIRKENESYACYKKGINFINGDNANPPRFFFFKENQRENTERKNTNEESQNPSSSFK